MFTSNTLLRRRCCILSCNKRNADVLHGRTSWESRLWASFWSLQLPPAVWQKLIWLHGQPITFIILLIRLRICHALHCVQLTGVFIRPPTACFFFRNEFSISSRRPTFSSWMDTKASISLEQQTRFCLLKSWNKSAAHQRQCDLFSEWGKVPLLGHGGSSRWAFGGWRVWFLLLFVGVVSPFGVKFYIFVRMKSGFTLRIHRKSNSNNLKCLIYLSIYLIFRYLSESMNKTSGGSILNAYTFMWKNKIKIKSPTFAKVQSMQSKNTRSAVKRPGTDIIYRILYC